MRSFSLKLYNYFSIVNSININQIRSDKLIQIIQNKFTTGSSFWAPAIDLIYNCSLDDSIIDSNPILDENIFENNLFIYMNVYSYGLNSE